MRDLKRAILEAHGRLLAAYRDNADFTVLRQIQGELDALEEQWLEQLSNRPIVELLHYGVYELDSNLDDFLDMLIMERPVLRIQYHPHYNSFSLKKLYEKAREMNELIAFLQTLDPRMAAKVERYLPMHVYERRLQEIEGHIKNKQDMHLAVAMATHARLGNASRLQGLEPELVRHTINCRPF
jgi:hypothetical protein